MRHDPAKRRKNLRKHKIDLPGCMEAFDGRCSPERMTAKITESNAW